MSDHDILIDEHGDIHFVYSDELVGVFEGEEQRTTRASHVEPFSAGGWFADMSPSGGPILFANGGVMEGDDRFWALIGMVGFKTRQEALDAEREWLRQEKGL